MILINFRFEFGWGDTFLNIYNCISLIEYIKQHTSLPIHFTINNKKESNALNVVLDLNYFNSICDTFKILNNKNSLNIVNGEVTYELKLFKRIYSLNNPDVNNSIPGGYDVFIEPKNQDYVKSLKIPFNEFKYGVTSKNVKDYPIYKQNLLADTSKFLNQDFESIYYRCTGNYFGFSSDIIQAKTANFLSYLTTKLDKTKKYFFCSNSAIIKKLVLENVDLNIILFRDLDKHDINHMPNGFSMLDEDAYFAVCEMLILGMSKRIHYSGEQTYISLFNFYPMSVKNVPLINIDTVI
jgi:hypothetical protein